LAAEPARPAVHGQQPIESGDDGGEIVILRDLRERAIDLLRREARVLSGVVAHLREQRRELVARRPPAAEKLAETRAVGNLAERIALAAARAQKGASGFDEQQRKRLRQHRQVLLRGEEFLEQ